MLIDTPHIFMHVGAFLSLVALAFRGPLKLRSILVFSILCTTIYHAIQQPHPSWQELPWNMVTFVINIVVLTQIVLDRTHFGLNPAEEALFSAFEYLTPGEFRQVIKMASWHTAGASASLTQEGAVPAELYYVLEGDVHLEKEGRTFTIAPGTFIGEVAFLRGSPASATVTLSPGARYVSWPSMAIKKAMKANAPLKTALYHLIGLDMAVKVANSTS